MLTVPTLLPSEIDRSYLGAIMRANGVVKKDDIEKKMASHTGQKGKSRRDVPCIKLLASLAQVQVASFVKHHTTLPLRRGITSYHPESEHGAEEENQSMLWTTAMRVARPGAYCCHACIEHDLATYGRSYWHREHQIPGQFWCSTHGTPLHYMEQERSFLSAPDQLLNDSRLVTEPWVNKSMGNRFIKSFLAISCELLSREKPFSVKHISGLLKEKALLHGLHSHSGKIKAPLLSDAIIDNFGREWLATVMPTLADKQMGKLLSQMDGVLYLTTSASSTSAYLLALAYLFETPEDALIALTHFDEISIKAGRARLIHKIDWHDLQSAYIRAHGSYAKTAKLLETTYSAICSRLSSMKLPNLKNECWQSMQKTATAFFVEGKSLRDSFNASGLELDMLEDFVRVTGALTDHSLLEQMNPKTGRGSGVRRPQKLAPNEVTLAKGSMATKFGQNLRREQRFSPLAA